MAFKNIYDELNRRNVIRAVITYVAVSWVILQAASIIFPALEFNQKAMKFLIVLLLIGFIPWVVFAWFYEYTGSGFRKTEEIPLDESITQSTGKRMNFIIIASLSLAVILLLADRQFDFTNKSNYEYSKKSIAVLPFENLSPDDDSYFTRGITEDILTQISKIEDLKVLSRFTLREYDTKGKTPRIIAEDLKVANLLSGSVRRSGDQLRIGCQLINPLDGSEVWAETFDRPLNNIFAVQSEVAEKVAFYLKSELSESNNIEIDFSPTENMIAYNHYLKGRDLYHSYNAGDNEKSINNYKLALEEDPNFALAMAALSGSYSQAVQIFSTRPYNYLDTAFVLAKESTILLPESSKTWHALGLVYDHKGLYEDAKRMYLTALEKNPNNEVSISNLALILKDEGELVESISLQKKSIEINPLNSLSYLGLAADYRRLEMYGESLATLEKASALDVNNWITDYYLAYTHICAGNYENARPYIEKILALDSTNLRYLEISGELYSYFDPVLSKKCFEKVVKSPTFDPRINFFAGVGIGHFLWEEGKIDSANVWLNDVFTKHQKLIQDGSEDLNSIMMLASIHGIRHENVEALSYLQKVPRAALDYVSWVRSPMSKSLQDDPAFVKLIEEEKRIIKEMREEVNLDVLNRVKLKD
ncbi:MAG: tetratricopeptide repeat protein [Saprospiraceae bacterium]|nr:tetratricopeptide repeat protein [Saprospiraceae bacterium]